MKKFLKSKKAVTKIQAVVLILIVAVAIIAASVYYYYGSTQPSLATEQTLILATTEASVDSLDPTWGWSKTTYYIASLCFEGLLAYKPPDCLEVEPRLAKNYTMSSDGKTFEFTLRDDVYFHDGTHFNATIAKTCLQRIIDLKVPMAYLYSDVDTIQASDTYTLKITLKNPNVFFLDTIAEPLGGDMYPVDAAIAAGDNWGKSVLLGSGPFKFSEYVPNDRCVLVRNDAYWGPKPKLEKIIIKYIPDPSTARLALETGEIDMFTDYALASDIPIMMANAKIEHQSIPNGKHRHLYFSQSTGAPLDNTLVRQAIAYAINRTRVWLLAYKGLGTTAESLIQNALTPYYKPTFEKYVHNTTRARELLAQAGYADGFSTDLYYTSYWDIRDVDAASVMAEDLAAVGIHVTTHFLEAASFWEKEYTDVGSVMPMDIDGWDAASTNPERSIMQYIHPDYGMDASVLAWNTSASQRFAELGYLGRSTTNVTEQIAIYNEAQDILADEVPTLPLTVDPMYVWYRSWVKDFHMYNNKDIYDMYFRDTYIAAH